MELVHEEEKRSEFRELLFKLGKESFSLKDRAARSVLYQQFEKVYYCVNPHECFRHFYSDIFSVLTEIKHDDTLGSVDILVLNLSEIRKGYHPCNKDSDGNIIDISDS